MTTTKNGIKNTDIKLIKDTSKKKISKIMKAAIKFQGGIEIIDESALYKPV